MFAHMRRHAEIKSSIKCKDCGYLLRSNNDLKAHARHVHSKYICDQCACVTVRWLDNYVRKVQAGPIENQKRAAHARKLHPGTVAEHIMVERDEVRSCSEIAPFTCKFCNETFTEDSLRHHRNYAKPCEMCGAVMAQCLLKEHVHKHGLMFACKLCNMHYRNKTTFRTHFFTVHADSYQLSDWESYVELVNGSVVPDEHFIRHGKNTKYMCGICGIVLIGHHNFITHKLVHDYKLQCIHCNKFFLRLADLQKHRIDVFNKNRFSCEECGTVFNWNHEAVRHSLQHDNLALGGQIECELCRKHFNSYEFLMHMHLKHRDVKKMVKCCLCDQRFQTMHYLRVHNQLMHPRRVCEYCGAMFYSELIFKEHRMQYRTYYRCDSCYQMFRTERQVKRHASESHTDKIKFESVKCTTCNYCKNVHSNISLLNKHIRIMHMRPRCKECLFTFKNSESLDAHMKLKHPAKAKLTQKRKPEVEIIVEDNKNNAKVEIKDTEVVYVNSVDGMFSEETVSNPIQESVEYLNNDLEGRIEPTGCIKIVNIAKLLSANCVKPQTSPHSDPSKPKKFVIDARSGCKNYQDKFNNRFETVMHDHNNYTQQAKWKYDEINFPNISNLEDAIKVNVIKKTLKDENKPITANVLSTPNNFNFVIVNNNRNDSTEKPRKVDEEYDSEETLDGFEDVYDSYADPKSNVTIKSEILDENIEDTAPIFDCDLKVEEEEITGLFADSEDSNQGPLENEKDLKAILHNKVIKQEAESEATNKDNFTIGTSIRRVHMGDIEEVKREQISRKEVVNYGPDLVKYINNKANATLKQIVPLGEEENTNNTNSLIEDLDNKIIENKNETSANTKPLDKMPKTENYLVKDVDNNNKNQMNKNIKETSANNKIEDVDDINIKPLNKTSNGQDREIIANTKVFEIVSIGEKYSFDLVKDTIGVFRKNEQNAAVSVSGDNLKITDLKWTMTNVQEQNNIVSTMKNNLSKLTSKLENEIKNRHTLPFGKLVNEKTDNAETLNNPTELKNKNTTTDITSQASTTEIETPKNNSFGESNLKLISPNPNKPHAKYLFIKTDNPLVKQIQPARIIKKIVSEIPKTTTRKSGRIGRTLSAQEPCKPQPVKLIAENVQKVQRIMKQVLAKEIKSSKPQEQFLDSKRTFIKVASPETNAKQQSSEKPIDEDFEGALVTYTIDRAEEIRNDKLYSHSSARNKRKS